MNKLLYLIRHGYALHNELFPKLGNFSWHLWYLGNSRFAFNAFLHTSPNSYYLFLSQARQIDQISSVC